MPPRATDGGIRTVCITDRKTAEEYVGALIKHLEEDQCPSPSMVDRVRSLLTRL